MELSLKFHAPVTGGEVRAVAKTELRDERTIEGIAEIFDANGVKTATFQSAFRIKRRGP